MSYRNNILNELKELSPTLAGIPKVNVFSVPDDYFLHLSSAILLQTSDKQFSATVPEDYFANLSNNIMARIKQEIAVESETNTAVLDGIGNKNIYTVPANYFEALADNIIARITNETVADETGSISTLVAGIGNSNVFTVPSGYFDGLSHNIAKQITPAKVIGIDTRRNVWRYAAAAVVTGIVAMSALFIFNNRDKPGLSKDNIAAIESAKTIISTNSFDKELASLNDDDIVNFLESKGQDVDAALVASLTEDEKVLPDADAYLFDENTLNEVLKNLDLNN